MALVTEDFEDASIEEKFVQTLLSVVKKEQRRQGSNRHPFPNYYDCNVVFEVKKDDFFVTRPTNLHHLINEIAWFFSGSPVVPKCLQSIWGKDVSREHLDNVGLTTRHEFVYGPGYGKQWRNFGIGEETWEKDLYASETVCSDEALSTFALPDDSAALTHLLQSRLGLPNYPRLVNFRERKGDQWLDLFKSLMTSPERRNHIVSSWNPLTANECVPPPCHGVLYFKPRVSPKCKTLYKLDVVHVQRSADLCVGAYTNVRTYSILTHLIVKCLNTYDKVHQWKVGKIVHDWVDAHVYEDHLEALKKWAEKFSVIISTSFMLRVRDPEAQFNSTVNTLTPRTSDSGDQAEGALSFLLKILIEREKSLLLFGYLETVEPGHMVTDVIYPDNGKMLSCFRGKFSYLV